MYTIRRNRDANLVKPEMPRGISEGFVERWKPYILEIPDNSEDAAPAADPGDGRQGQNIAHHISMIIITTIIIIMFIKVNQYWHYHIIVILLSLLLLLLSSLLSLVVVS